MIANVELVVVWALRVDDEEAVADIAWSVGVFVGLGIEVHDDRVGFGAVVTETSVHGRDRPQAVVDAAGALVRAVDLEQVGAEAGPDGDAADVVACALGAFAVLGQISAEGDRAFGKTDDVDLGVGVRQGSDVGRTWHGGIEGRSRTVEASTRRVVLRDRHRGVGAHDRAGCIAGRVGHQHVVAIEGGFVADHERLAARATSDVEATVDVVDGAGQEVGRRVLVECSLVADVDAIVAFTQAQVRGRRSSLDVGDVVTLAQVQVQDIEAVVVDARVAIGEIDRRAGAKTAGVDVCWIDEVMAQFTLEDQVEDVAVLAHRQVVCERAAVVVVVRVGHDAEQLGQFLGSCVERHGDDLSVTEEVDVEGAAVGIDGDRLNVVELLAVDLGRAACFCFFFGVGEQDEVVEGDQGVQVDLVDVGALETNRVLSVAIREVDRGDRECWLSEQLTQHCLKRLSTRAEGNVDGRQRGRSSNAAGRVVGGIDVSVIGSEAFDGVAAPDARSRDRDGDDGDAADGLFGARDRRRV